jgi:hypothetical protein
MSDQSRSLQEYVREAAKRAAGRGDPVFVARVVEQLDGAAMNQAVSSRPAGEAVAAVEEEGWQLTDINAALSPDLKALTLMTVRPADGKKRSGRVYGFS